MKFVRSFPLMYARIRWPFSSSTTNDVFGSGSTTVPSTSIESFFANKPPIRTRYWVSESRDGALRSPQAREGRQ